MRDFRMHSKASVLLKLGTLLLAVIGLGALVAHSIQPAQAQEANLLANPSFEGPYGSFVPPGGNPDCPAGICTTAQTAAGWTPWWWIVAGRDNAIYANPEYKPAEARDFAARVRSGERAQQYFNFGRTNTAGVFQQVSVPTNARLRFSVWGMAWSTGIAWDGPYSDVTYSAEPTPVNLRVGIDPTGGTDAFSANIIWSGTLNPYDQYALLSVDAQAQGSLVTVFTYSSPNEPRKHNDIYWDDASLVVLGAGGAPVVTNPGGGGSAAAAPAAPVSFVLAPTATPDAEGVIYAAVPPGGSIWSVAANAGITLDQILEYNNLSRDDFVNAGQLLIVGYGEPAGEGAAAAETPAEATPEAEGAALAATSEITATGAISEAAAITDTARLAQTAPEAAPAAAETGIGAEAAAAAPATEPEAAAAVETGAEAPATGILVSEPEASGASICLKAFEDDNQNGLHDPGEALRANVAFTVSNDQRVVSNYVTTGTSEPYCLPGLAPGNYQVTRSQQNDEVLTTRGNWGIALTDGSVVTMEFGSYTSQAVASADQNATSAELPAAAGLTNAAATQAEAGQSGGLANGITIAAVVLAALLLVVVVGLLLTARRAS